MSKRSKACEFPPETKKAIKKRDCGCYFCQIGYQMSPYSIDRVGSQCMHVVNRSQGGLGVIQNGIEGCIYHHEMLDNSKYSDEMRTIAEDYMKSLYPGWTRESVTYNKYKNLVVYKSK